LSEEILNRDVKQNENFKSVISRRPAVLVVVAAIAGLALGIFTFLGQGIANDEWNTLVNSGAVWSLAAFIVGAFGTFDLLAVGVGITTLLGAVAGYYVSATIKLGFESAFSGIIFWGLVAVVAGPLFGLAGYWWRNKARWQHMLAIGFLGGIFAGEGVYTLLLIPHKPISGWVMLVFGLLVPLVLGRSAKDRLYGLLIVPVIVILILAFYQFLNWALAGFPL
jgi:MFS family permease